MIFKIDEKLYISHTKSGIYSTGNLKMHCFLPSGCSKIIKFGNPRSGSWVHHKNRKLFTIVKSSNWQHQFQKHIHLQQMEWFSTLSISLGESLFLQITRYKNVAIFTLLYFSQKMLKLSPPVVLSPSMQMAA